jgi:hypothetical protein
MAVQMFDSVDACLYGAKGRADQFPSNAIFLSNKFETNKDCAVQVGEGAGEVEQTAPARVQVYVLQPKWGGFRIVCVCGRTPQAVGGSRSPMLTCQLWRQSVGGK